MKRSIKIKLFISIMSVALIIIILSIFLNTTYLQKYYLEKKKDSLITYGETIKKIYDDNIEEIDLELEKIKNNLPGDISIYSLKGDLIYTSTFIQHRGRGYGQGQGHNNRNITLTEEGLEKILKGEILLEKYSHPRFNTDYLILSLALNNSDILILETPIERIKESVAISLDFYLYIALFSLIIAILMSYLFSKSLTKPILHLNKVAESMAKLDFSTKYEGKNDDELGELGSSINYLSDKLENTISDLNIANLKLKEDIKRKEKIDQMRKEFISNVSHELKTPIALIQGYAEGLKDNVITDQENKEYYCDVIIDEADKMGNLVHELLKLAKIESGHINLNLQSFNITELIKNVLYNYKPILEKEKINLTFNPDLNFTVKGDIFWIEQVLINFLNNALNHIDQNKSLKINLKEQKDKILISIFNSGKPIPQGELEKIWDNFYKVDKSRTRSLGGTGLGLSVVKGILDLHHCPYGVNNLSDGVLFWFSLEKKD